MRTCTYAEQREAIKRRRLKRNLRLAGITINLKLFTLAHLENMWNAIGGNSMKP